MKIANDNNFDELIKEKKIVLVDFYAVWCMPCQMQAKILDKLDKELENVEIVKVNVDEAINVANKFEIQSIPTLLVLNNGKVVSKSVGLTDESELLHLIAEAKD